MLTENGGALSGFGPAQDSFNWACGLAGKPVNFWYDPGNVYSAAAEKHRYRTYEDKDSICITDTVRTIFDLRQFAVALRLNSRPDSVKVVLRQPPGNACELHAGFLLTGGSGFAVLDTALVVSSTVSRASCVVRSGNWQEFSICVSRHDVGGTDDDGEYSISIYPLGDIVPERLAQVGDGDTFCIPQGEMMIIRPIAEFRNPSPMERSFNAVVKIACPEDSMTVVRHLSCEADTTVRLDIEQWSIVRRGDYYERCWVTDSEPGLDCDSTSLQIAFTVLNPDSGAPPPPPPPPGLGPSEPGPLNNDFEDGFPPPGGSANSRIKVRQCCWHPCRESTGIYPDWGSQYACLRWPGPGEYTDFLTSPTFDCRGYDSVTLTLRTRFTPREGSGYTALLRVSCDDGVHWSALKSYSSYLDRRETLDLGVARDSARVRLQWYWQGDSTKVVLWCVDDVVVHGSPLRGHDVGVSQILYPPARVPAGLLFVPAIAVTNFGCASEDSVECGLVVGYGSTAPYRRDTVLSLRYWERRTVEFDAWQPPLGVNCTMYAWVRSRGDQMPANDTFFSHLTSVEAEWCTMAIAPLRLDKPTCLAGLEYNYGSTGLDTACVMAISGRQFEIKRFLTPNWRSGGSGTWDNTGNPLPVKAGSMGAAVAGGGGDTLYYFSGTGKRQFCRYVVRENTWSLLPALPFRRVRKGAALAWDKGDCIYAFTGNSKRMTPYLYWSSFMRYSKSRNTWDTLSPLPTQVQKGAALAAPGGDYVFAFSGSGDPDDSSPYRRMYRYQVSQNRWDETARPPFVPYVRSCLAAGPGQVYAHDGRGRFMVYDLDQNTWRIGPSLGVAAAIRGGALAFTSGALYSVGEGRTQLKRYVDSTTVADSGLVAGYSPPPMAQILFDPWAGIAGRLDSIEDEPPARYSPQFSPDGDWVCYSTMDTSDDFQLCKVPADSMGEVVLSSGPALRESPRWSPSGEWLAFSSDSALGKVKGDGTGETLLVTGQYGDPDWSPDGEWLACRVWIGRHTLRIVSADGDSVRELTPVGHWFTPRFSPDGHWIAAGRIENGWHQIWKISVDSGTQVQLTSDAASHELARWSHDGQWLVYEYWTPGGRTQLHRVQADGSYDQTLTWGDVYDFGFPSFSLTDQWVICTRSDDSTAQICLVPTQGGSTTTLTNTPTLKCYPELSPDNEWAAYEEQTSLDNGAEGTVIGRVRTGLADIAGPDGATRLPLRFEFAAPVPNPAHGVVTFRYAVPDHSRLTLAIYDVTGKQVTTPMSGEFRVPGWHRLTWDRADRQGRHSANGIYFCRLTQVSGATERNKRRETRTRKLVLE